MRTELGESTKREQSAGSSTTSCHAAHSIFVRKVLEKLDGIKEAREEAYSLRFALSLGDVHILC